MALADELFDTPVLPHQLEALTSPSKTLMLPAGLGAGKTKLVVMLALYLGELNAPVPGMVVEPTIPMLRDILVPEFREYFERIGIPEDRGYTSARRSPPCYRYLKQEKNFEVHLGDGVSFEIRLRSAHDPENLSGGNLAYVILDEAGFMKMDAFKRTMPRTRHPAAKRRMFVATGTPEGLGPFYHFAEAHPKDGTHLIRASTRANIFLPDGPDAYIEQELGHFSERDREQYVDGRFIARGGRVYDALDEERHFRPVRDPLAGELALAFDFGTMTGYAALCSIVTDRSGQEVLRVFGEVVARRSGTHRLVEGVKAKLRDLFRERVGASKWEDIAERIVGAYTDSSPWQRSDRHLVARDLDVPVIKRKRNPGIMDRVYSLNELPKRDRLVVDEEQCPYLARCLKQQGYDPRTGLPEKSHDDGEGPPGLDHAPDALGYLASHRWPVLAPRGNQGARTWH